MGGMISAWSLEGSKGKVLKRDTRRRESKSDLSVIDPFLNRGTGCVGEKLRTKKLRPRLRKKNHLHDFKEKKKTADEKKKKRQINTLLQ